MQTMRKEGLTEVLTNDRHFEKEGFRALFRDFLNPFPAPAIFQRRSRPNFLPLPGSRFSRILEGMEVHFTPETEEKLKDLAAQSGRGNADELVQDVVEGVL